MKCIDVCLFTAWGKKMVIDDRPPKYCQKCGRAYLPGWSICAVCDSSENIYLPEPTFTKPYKLPETPTPVITFQPSDFRKTIELPVVMKAVSRRQKKRRLIRIVILCLAIFFIICIGLFWELSLVGVVAGYWAAIFGAALAVLGVLFTFFQWVFPHFPESSKKTDSMSLQ